MTFLYIKYLPALILLFFVLSFIWWRIRSKFYDLVYDYWFVKSSWYSRISFFIFLASILVFFTALLDLRGEEEKISADIPDQKTILMIDTSASMLSDDVRPSRFQKALLMARHFVKNAAGHQISVVLFSDIQKQIVPFTDDIDLLEARIEGLKSMKLKHGGSNISQALSEVSIYFKNSRKGQNSGNVILYTDGEEGVDAFKISKAKGITLAVVGIGTAKGSKIPLRDRSNRFTGYKRYKGKDVVTKLNENFFKELGTHFKSYRYWIAQSYTIPTEEILQFFRQNFTKSNVKGEIITRPVLGYVLIKVAIVLMIISIFFKQFRTFTYLILIMSIIPSLPTYGQSKIPSKEELKKQKVEEKNKKEIAPYMQGLKDGTLSYKQRLKMGEILLKQKKLLQAKEVYTENRVSIEKDSPDVVYNYALLKTLTDEKTEGISLMKSLIEKYPNSKKLIEVIQKTLLKVLTEEKNKKNQNKKNKNKDKKQDKKKDQKQNQKQDQSKDQKQNQKQDQKKDQKQNQKQDQKKDQKQNQKQDQKKDSKPNQKKNQKQEEKQQQNKDKKEDNKNKKSEKENKEKKDKNDSEGKKKDLKDKEKKKNKPRTIKEKEAEIKRKRRMTRVPTILKKILSDDRKLQEQYIDTKTDKRDYKKQDW